MLNQQSLEKAMRQTGNPGFTLRELKPDDAKAASILIRETIDGVPSYNTKSKQHEAAKYTPELLLEYISANRKHIQVAELHGTLVGFIVSQPDEDLLWLEWFGVAATSRNSGVGKSLLLSLISYAEELGCHKIWCDTRSTNRISQLVLTKANFTPICQLRNHWYGQDYILWERLSL